MTAPLNNSLPTAFARSRRAAPNAFRGDPEPFSKQFCTSYRKVNTLESVIMIFQLHFVVNMRSMIFPGVKFQSLPEGNGVFSVAMLGCLVAANTGGAIH